MSDCPNCERLRRYSHAQSRLITRLHRRAQAAESALHTYIKAMQQTGGIHESLYRPEMEGRIVDRAVEGASDE